MSEYTLVEIISTGIRDLYSTSSRIRAMSREIKRNYLTLELQAENILNRKNIQANIHKIRSDVKTIQPISSKAELINNQMNHINEARRFVATMKSLSSPVLKPLVTGSKGNFIKTKSLANEVENLLTTNNFQTLKTKGHEIKSAFQNVVSTIRLKHIELAKQEQITTKQVLKNSLKQIGYSSIKQIYRGEPNILRATNDKTSIFAKVDMNGAMKIYAAGFPGRDCEKTINALFKKLKNNEIVVMRKERVFHGKAEGGELVNEVEQFFNPLIENPKTPIKKDNLENERRQRTTMLKNRQRIKCH